MRSLLTGVMLIALAAGAFAADPDDPVAACYSKAAPRLLTASASEKNSRLLRSSTRRLSTR